MELVNLSCSDFAEKLAGKDPVPGGGGASALAGALGVCLGNMVGALTVGKKKYADVEREMYDLCGSAEMLRMELLALVEEDAEVFMPLAQAYRMPSGTQEEKARKEETMEEALLDAVRVPLKIMHACCRAIDLLEAFAEKGSVMAVSDAGAGAALCLGALRAASFNVYINTKAMKDTDRAKAFEAEADEMTGVYLKKAGKICDEVEAFLRKE